MQNDELAIVYECQSVNDAEFTKSILESYGIPSKIIDTSSSELVRFRFAIIARKGFVKLLVKKSDFEAASEILNAND